MVQVRSAAGLVAGVRPHMPRDHVPATRRVRTLRTFVRFLAGVCALMRRQVVGPREHLAADSTSVGFDARVQSHVPRQHVAPRERSLAHLAQVGFGRRVAVLSPALVPGRHVLGEAVVETEHLSADGTNVGDVRTGRHFFDHGVHF